MADSVRLAAAAPYDYILVKFENDFGVGASRFVKGQSYVLPALYVYLMFRQDTKQAYKASAEVGLMAALTVLGVSEVAAAVRAASTPGFLAGVLDMGLGIGDIAVNLAFKNEMEQAYPGFVDNFNKVTLGWGVGRLSGVGLDAAFRKAYIESEVAKFDIRLSAESKNTASKIKNQLKGNPAQFAEFQDVIDSFEEQVRLVKANPFVEGRKIEADVVNYAFAERYGLPPHKAGTMVEGVKAVPGKKMYCVEYSTQDGPGNFLADETFETEEEAREKLALIWNFKPSHDLVLREYTVKSEFIFNKSEIGPQFDPVLNKTFQGGKIQFEIPNEIKLKWDEYFSSSKRTIIKDLRK